VFLGNGHTLKGIPVEDQRKHIRIWEDFQRSE
jgi:hypothetical protein